MVTTSMARVLLLEGSEYPPKSNARPAELPLLY